MKPFFTEKVGGYRPDYPHIDRLLSKKPKSRDKRARKS
jgi:hypothetical protein